MTSSILFVISAYKDKDLFKKVSEIELATSTPSYFKIVDQHPIDHISDFAEKDNCSYKHRLWDDMKGPAYYRYIDLLDYLDLHEYVCIISPDIELSQDWDIEALDFLKDNENAILSGSGNVSVFQKDLFSIEASYTDSKHFGIAQYVNRNFILTRSENFKQIVFPLFLKYYGESEYLTVSFLSKGKEIYTMPSSLYKDSGYRSIEKNYHTFSLEHNYNLVVDILKGNGGEYFRISQTAIKRFLSFHGIDASKIYPLPYQTNDVNYDPYDLKMHDVDSRRFLSVVKAVY